MMLETAVICAIVGLNVPRHELSGGAAGRLAEAGVPEFSFCIFLPVCFYEIVTKMKCFSMGGYDRITVKRGAPARLPDGM